MIELESYPIIRECPLPNFLSDNYRDTAHFIEHLKNNVKDIFIDIDEKTISNAFPDLKSLHGASRQELLMALSNSTNPPLLVATLQSYMVWSDPEFAKNIVEIKVKNAISSFPKTLNDLEGSFGKDLMDSIITAFTYQLVSKQRVEFLNALILHKCMMKLENLIGGLHQEVLGIAADGDRVAEPRGAKEEGKINKETWHETLNPYAGADARKGQNSFYQIKNKTGSAKGSDGSKLGGQLKELSKRYPNSKTFYLSMIGKTLVGHRSMGAFIRVSPTSEVLVGLSAFQELGQHRDTPLVVMELYISVLSKVTTEIKYNTKVLAKDISIQWDEKYGNEDPVFRMLRDAITTDNYLSQSSKTYEEYKIFKEGSHIN